MKLNGKDESRMEMVIPIPRPSGDDLVFIMTPVVSYEDFSRLCQMPKPPILKKAGGVEVADVEDEGFLAQLRNYAEQQAHFVFLNSVKKTPGLEFDTVDMEKPSTWGNYQKEMAAFGLTDAEVARLIRAAQAANGLDDGLVDEARNRYFRNLADERKRKADEVSTV